VDIQFGMEELEMIQATMFPFCWITKIDLKSAVTHTWVMVCLCSNAVRVKACPSAVYATALIRGPFHLQEVRHRDSSVHGLHPAPPSGLSQVRPVHLPDSDFHIIFELNVDSE
jgi:hypothetical protein